MTKTIRLFPTVNRSTSLKTSVDQLLLIALFTSLTLLLLSGTIGRLISDTRRLRYLDELIFFAFLIVLISAILIKGRLYLSRTLALLVLFSAIGILASFVNQVPRTIAILGLLLAIKPMVLLIANQMMPLSYQGAEKSASWMHYFLLAITITSVAYVVFFELILKSNPLPGVTLPNRVFGITPVRSFFPHPSPLSSIMTLAALYFFTRFLILGGKRNLFYLGFAVFGVVLTGRMKALFMLPLGLFLLFLLTRIRSWNISRRSLLQFFLMFVFCIGVISLITFLFRDLLTLRLLEGASNVRFVLHQQALEIIKDTNGLGAGFGMYGSAVSINSHYSPLYEQYGLSSLRGATQKNPVFITDQWWAWYIGETGVLGFLVLVTAFILVIWGLWKISIHWYTRKPEISVLGYSAMVFLLFGILSGYASTYLTSPPTAYILMALAGLVFAVDRALLRKEVSSSTISPET